MEKELKEMLKELENGLGDLLNGNTEVINTKIQNKLNEALKDETTISIKKHKDGSAEICTKGNTIAILITLAGLEKAVLKNLKTPDTVWETIKEVVGTRENNNE